MQAFREFKALWDPDNRMNPGKLVDAVRVYDPVENLRHGPGSAASTADGHEHTRARNALRLRQGRRLAGARHRALRGRGRMPQGERRRHVPQLSRHRRRAALHPRPRPPAVGDAGRRPARGRLPERSRARGARPLPQLQGLQDRVPGAGGHGRLQVRVPGPALQGPPASAASLHLRLRRQAGAVGFAHARR